MADGSHLEATDRVMFETDRTGIIRGIGENSWNAFAKENGAADLEADQIVGRSLFDFIEGTPVQDQIRWIMEKIAQDPNWAWVLPFRCDAPDRKRVMCQSLKPVFTGDLCTGFLFQSFEQYSQQRPPMGLYDFKKLRKLADEDSQLPLVRMCSWCQRVRNANVGGDTWISAEDYYAAGGRSEVRISHTICDECLKTTADPFPTEVVRP